jgi:RNA polymerase sigma factor (sigma-70 family)
MGILPVLICKALPALSLFSLFGYSMNSRHDIIAIFSTFIQFADGDFSRWIADPKLRRSMQASLQRVAPSEQTDLKDSFWSLYWFRKWQAQAEGMAIAHLSAYLQESCYWAARSLTAQQGSLSDSFQVAIADLPKLLKGYDPQQSASLKTYSNIAFSNTIRDVQRQRGEADSRSDWGLLRKVSQKRLIESLQMAGLSESTIACYCLSWTCFKTFCAPMGEAKTRQLARPDAAAWNAIAQLYNRQRSTQLPSGTPAADPATLERWLKESAKRIRAYLHPQVTSLNINQFESGREIQEDLPDLNETPFTTLMIQEEIAERQAQQTQIGEVLAIALTQLDAQTQELLSLYYQQKLTQQQIAAQLDVKQYTVSRRFSRAKESLLLTLAKWSQETLHISLTSPVVKHMNVALEEWLQAHYQTASSLPGRN